MKKISRTCQWSHDHCEAIWSEMLCQCDDDDDRDQNGLHYAIGYVNANCDGEMMRKRRI